MPNQRCFLLLVSLFLLTASLIFAQSQANTGAIEGVVTDPAGRVVPGAEVTVTNLGTNFTRVLKTDADGRFRGLLLPLGPYKVTVKAPTFGTLVREGLDLAVGQTTSLSWLALSLSQVSEVFSSTPAPPIIRPRPS